MQSSVLCGVRVNMMERQPLVAIGRKATDRIHDTYSIQKIYCHNHVYLLSYFMCRKMFSIFLHMEGQETLRSI